MSIQLNNLNALYTKLLNAMDVRINDHHELIQTIDNVDTNVLVANKQVYMPHKDIVNNYYTGNMVIFHPLSENIMRGESPVLQELRALMMDFLSQRILDVIDGLLRIANNEEMVKTLSPNQIDALRAAGGVDEKSIANWQALMRRAESRGSAKRVMTIFLKRGTTLNDKAYKRAAIVNFNLYQLLTEGSLNVFGVKLRKADCTLYAKMFDLVIKDVAIIDKYTVGSDSMVAPYFDALVRAFSGVLSSINGVTWLFRKPLKEVKGSDLHTKDEFGEILDNLNQCKDALPPQKYNDGDASNRRDEAQQPQVETQTTKPAQPVEEVKPLPITDIPGVSSASTKSHDYYAYNAPQQSQHVSQQLPPINQQLGAMQTQAYNPFAALHQPVGTMMYPQHGLNMNPIAPQMPVTPGFPFVV